MTDDTQQNLARGSTWLRLVFMVLYAVAFYMATWVLLFVAIIQFVCKLLTGHVFVRLMGLGQSRGLFVYQIIAYETFRTEQRPFPFNPWPPSTIQAGRRRTDQRRPTGARAAGERGTGPGAAGERRPSAGGPIRFVRTPACAAQDRAKTDEPSDNKPTK
ncbi:MAG: DUF4389 domain-containing protein [Alphaproteobacteria bacterium]|nr:DUF4389 domain-containing protein [Alphaproteobacteria bacterium]